MKNLIFTFIILMSVLFTAYSEDSKSEIQLPTSPAMNIIGIQTSEITKPGNYTGVFTSLISPILSKNGTIPTDLAIEFSPYWLESRDIIIKELENTNVFRDLKISIASNSVFDSDSNFYSRLGIGFRTYLLPGNLHEKVKKTDEIRLSTVTKIITLEDMDSTEINQEKDRLINSIGIEKIREKVAEIIEDNIDNPKKRQRELARYREELEKFIFPDGSRWDYSLRKGHFLELAGAIALDFPKNTFEYTAVRRWGIWLNYTYRPDFENQSLDMSAIARISNYSLDPTVNFKDETIFGDLGINMSWKIPGTKFLVSGELLAKVGFSNVDVPRNDNTITLKTVKEHKWDITIGYEITPNTIWSISISDIGGNKQYLKEKAMQLLLGISVALVPMGD